MIPFLDLKAQHHGLTPEIQDAIARVADSCQFVLGPETEQFEEAYARYCGVRYAVAVNSGTTALHLALLIAGVKPGDEVITTPYTFVATAAAIRYVGARPVFVDIDARTCTIDPAQIEPVISPRSRAIIPVHLYGRCAAMEPILALARRRGLTVIEDAAQAAGAEYQGHRAGSLGDIGCFSFYPGKNLGAWGDGGALVTNDARSAAIARMLRDHGQSRKYHHEVLGYNWRLAEIQAAVLRIKLRHLDRWNDARRRHAETYRRLFADTRIGVLEEPRNGLSIHHLFPIFTPERDRLREFLTVNGVGTGIHYPIPVHMQPPFRDLAYSVGAFPRSERAAAETLSLPMYAELAQDAQLFVSERVRTCLESEGVRPGPGLASTAAHRVEAHL